MFCWQGGVLPLSSVYLFVGLSCFLCPVLFGCCHLTSRIFSVYKVGAKVRLENTHDAVEGRREWELGRVDLLIQYN